MPEFDPNKSFVHINDLSLEAVKSILDGVIGDEKIYALGDCGSVWHEWHEGEADCPWPHLLVEIEGPETPDAVIEKLKRNEIGFVYTGFEYGDQKETWRWKEDDRCLDREDTKIDYRR